MNKRALTISIIYCALVICFKLFIILGGYALSKFGFYYSNFVSILAIIPFMFIAIHQVREKDLSGKIESREAARIALTVLAIATIILSVYNYFEFNIKYKELAGIYYNSNEYLEILKKQQALYPDKVKTENFPKIIAEQIAQLSAFKATTGKLIPMLMIGLGGAFAGAITLKRK